MTAVTVLGEEKVENINFKSGMILILKFAFKKCCTVPIKNSSFKARRICLETEGK